MSKGFILLFMCFMHIFSDFTLQGIMANMKQKSWWKENTKNSYYKNDWIPVLICHSFEWSFCIMLPIFYYLNFQLNKMICIVFILNMLLHFLVDHSKCNLFKINLIEDQFIHLLQIVITYCLLIL